METREYHIVGIESIGKAMLRDILTMCGIRTHNLNREGDTFTIYQSHAAHVALLALLKMNFDDLTVLVA